MEKVIKRKLFCPYCETNKGYITAASLTRHMKDRHPEIDTVTRLRLFADFRYPGLDIDKVIKRYLARLECTISLGKKRIHIQHLLAALGIKRHWRADNVLLRALKHEWVQTAEDVTKFFADGLGNIDRTKESRLENAVSIQRSRLENSGVSKEVADIKEIVMRANFARRELEAAILESDKKNGIERPSKQKPIKYICIDPQGNEHKVTSLPAFCTEHKIIASEMYTVLSGKKPHHKKWKIRRFEQ
jgi:hypothetical protein